MAVNMVHTSDEFKTRKTILVAPELAFAIPVIVGGTEVVKAGTPVASADGKGVLLARQTEVTAKDSYDDTVDGILLHDVDPTKNPNGTLLVSGYVDLLKLDSDVAAKYEDLTRATNKGKIVFVKSL